MRYAVCFGWALVLALAMPAIKAEEKWDSENGNPAPAFIAAGWCGTPVSLDAIRGNTVVLAFWNADVVC